MREFLQNGTTRYFLSIFGWWAACRQAKSGPTAACKCAQRMGGTPQVSVRAVYYRPRAPRFFPRRGRRSGAPHNFSSRSAARTLMTKRCRVCAKNTVAPRSCEWISRWCPACRARGHDRLPAAGLSQPPIVVPIIRFDSIRTCASSLQKKTSNEWPL